MALAPRRFEFQVCGFGPNRHAAKACISAVSAALNTVPDIDRLCGLLNQEANGDDLDGRKRELATTVLSA